ncbi:unnamed protein product [Bursaphelenchus okinawaensis]|uniref:Potassium channel tetramerisation-type BTB domain-containing protein n=1 Tax=Bursaphelenchus okinawaensis TaxID=465554 RepID=A0A811KCT2_9BILA|nr:unnamed protein product [Bursaphelenchus okinawaensis]CAG9102118.1 unnamed protein product [Bursaphelenchus okinawaensis]
MKKHLRSEASTVKYDRSFSNSPVFTFGMSRAKHTDDIMNINVGGKRYTVRRSDLIADPRSKLADWFRPNNNRPVPTDKGGNIYLDRDAKTFRHILAYLRLKKDRLAPTLALPSKPDDLAKLVAECEALNLAELKDAALNLLHMYERNEEQHYVTTYVQSAVRDFENWTFESDNGVNSEAVKRLRETSVPETINLSNSAYDEWDNL